MTQQGHMVLLSTRGFTSMIMYIDQHSRFRSMTQNYQGGKIYVEGAGDYISEFAGSKKYIGW